MTSAFLAGPAFIQGTRTLTDYAYKEAAPWGAGPLKRLMC
jgi:hypothetical protein